MSKRWKVSDEELDELLKHSSIREELTLSDAQRAKRDERRRRKRDELLRLAVTLVDENGTPDSERVDAFLREASSRNPTSEVRPRTARPQPRQRWLLAALALAVVAAVALWFAWPSETPPIVEVPTPDDTSNEIAEGPLPDPPPAPQPGSSRTPGSPIGVYIKSVDRVLDATKAKQKVRITFYLTADAEVDIHVLAPPIAYGQTPPNPVQHVEFGRLPRGEQQVDLITTLSVHAVVVTAGSGKHGAAAVASDPLGQCRSSRVPYDATWDGKIEISQFEASFGADGKLRHAWEASAEGGLSVSMYEIQGDLAHAVFGKSAVQSAPNPASFDLDFAIPGPTPTGFTHTPACGLLTSLFVAQNDFKCAAATAVTWVECE